MRRSSPPTERRRPDVLVCPDKFRRSLDATEVAEVVASELQHHGLLPHVQPMSDGGEGFLDALVAPDRRRPTTVTGPAGRPATARWGSTHDGTAVIEASQVCGHSDQRWLIRAPERPDPRA
jgi:glycerate kinase